MSDGIPWDAIRGVVRDWIIVGATGFVAPDHIIWAGGNHPIPDGMYITIDIVQEDDYGYDRSELEFDELTGAITERLIGDRTVELMITVYGGVNTPNAMTPWRVASRVRAAGAFANVQDAMTAAGVAVMQWTRITTPGRGLNSTIFEPRAMFSATLAVVSDLSVTGPPALSGPGAGSSGAPSVFDTANGSAVVDTMPFAFSGTSVVDSGTGPTPLPDPPTIATVGALVAANSASTLTPAMPTHAAGDILLVVLAALGNNNYTLSTPNGFAEVTGSPQHNNSDTNSARLHVWWKRAASGAETSPVVADVPLDDSKAALIIVVRGCRASGNPWDTTSSGTAIASTVVSAPGLTTTSQSTLVLAIVAARIDAITAQFSAWANGSLGSFAEVADASTNSGAGFTIGAAAGTLSTPGAVGASTATLAASSTQAYLTLALSPV